MPSEQRDGGSNLRGAAALGQLPSIISLLHSSKTGWDHEWNTGRSGRIILGLEVNLSSSGHPT